MKITILLLLLAFTLSGSAQKLEKKWSTEKVLITPESVLYNSELGIVFVANMGEKRDVESGDGFISQMNLDGKITNLKWLTGLNDPKGMAVWQGKLYVSDINKLVVIDIKTAKVEKNYPMADAKFLNDVTVCKNGMVFVSDSHDQHIYALKDDEFSLWLIDEKLKGVNGLWAELGKLYAGNGSVWEIDIETKTLTELFDGAGGIDGLETIGNGNFIFSNWAGRIFVSDNGKVVKLVDTSEAKINTADLDFIPEKKMVLVPTFFGNSVDAYELVW
jgi:outer membrane protein assembly factor BamB